MVGNYYLRHILECFNKFNFPSSKWLFCLVHSVCGSVKTTLKFSSAQFSHSVVSDSLPPHGLQRARPPCPSPTPRLYSNSCPLSWWCHPTISSSVVPFSCLQFFPASGSFPMSLFFESGGQSIGVSASISVLPMNIQDWFPLDGLVGSPCSPRDSWESLIKHHSSKASLLWCSVFFIGQLSHPYMITGKTIALTRWTFVGKVTSLLVNMLSRLVITFLPRSKCLFLAAVTICSDFRAQENKVSHCFPIYCHWSLPDAFFHFWFLCISHPQTLKL